jgi:hypothetical protein
MKDDRKLLEVNSFKGGLDTETPVVNFTASFSPDCLNVYADGPILRKRAGISKLNSVAVGTGSSGRGLFNWVKSANSQLLVSVFGGNLYSMDLSGSAWDGTWDSISPDSTNGSSLSDSFTHFITFSGALLFTQESRIVPQKMLVNDNSHFDIDFNGVGTAPLGKYIQVWKNHVWILNIGAGGTLTEDCNSIATWTDNDTSTGASTQQTFSGQETFRFVSGSVASDDARRTRDVGDLTDNYIVETRTYFDTLNTSSSGDYAEMGFKNGVIEFRVRFSDDGIDIHNGSSWVETGVDLVAEDAFAVWKFFISGASSGSARLEVIKNGTVVGLNRDITNADATSDGEINLYARAGASGTAADWYLDYLYVNTNSAATVEYFTDGDYSEWDDASTPTAPNEVAQPLAPYLNFACDDNAASTTVIDSGTGGNNGTLEGGNNTSDLNTTGKLGDAFQFDDTVDSVNIDAIVSTVRTDSVASIAFWAKAGSTAGAIWTVRDADADRIFSIRDVGGGTLDFGHTGGLFGNWRFKTDAAVLSTGTFKHVAFVLQGTAVPLVYVNASTVATTNQGTGTDYTKYLDANFDEARFGSFRSSGGANNDFFGGVLDDFRYIRANLTSVEVADIYNSGDGNDLLSTTVREGTTVKLGTFSYRINIAGNVGLAFTSQTLASGSGLAGTKSVVGAFINANSGMPYYIRVDDGTNVFSSSVTSGNGTWQYKTFEFTPQTGAGTVKTQFVFTSSGTVYVDDVSVVPLPSAASLDDNSDRIQRSALGFLNDWSGVDSGSNDIVTSGDTGLTGSAILADRMYVFKKYSIHRFSYTGSTPLVDIKQVVSGIGTASPRSIKNVVIPGVGDVLIFLGTDRNLYMFDGFELKNLSKKITNDNGLTSIYMQNINSQALDSCHAVVHNNKNWYELFVPLSTNTSPTHSIAYDFQEDSFWGFSNRNFGSAMISDRGDGLREVYAQANTNGFVYLTQNTNSDDGTNINGYWTSGKLDGGSVTMLSKIDEVEITTASTASSTPLFSWRADFESAWVDKTLAESLNRHNYDPGRIDNYIQFKIQDNSSNPTFQLWDITGLYRRIGHGR